jgi:hypothetical protein
MSDIVSNYLICGSIVASVNLILCGYKDLPFYRSIGASVLIVILWPFVVAYFFGFLFKKD